MHCERCGKKLKENALFCEICGTKVPQQGADKAEDVAEKEPDTSGVDVSAYPTMVQPPVGDPVIQGTMPMPVVEQKVVIAPDETEKNKKKKPKKPVIIAVVASVIVLVAIAVLVISLVAGGAEEVSDADSGSEPIRGYTSVQEMENSRSKGNEAQNTESPQSDLASEAERAINGPNGYVLSESDKRNYTENELAALTDYELYIARNEIYARHGREFNNQDLQDYFHNKNWYTARYSPDSFDSMVTLNSYEKKNAETILAIEKRRGSSYLS